MPRRPNCSRQLPSMYPGGCSARQRRTNASGVYTQAFRVPRSPRLEISPIAGLQLMLRFGQGKPRFTWLGKRIGPPQNCQCVIQVPEVDSRYEVMGAVEHPNESCRTAFACHGTQRKNVVLTVDRRDNDALLFAR